MIRCFETVAAGCGRFNRHFAVRDLRDRRIYCADLNLTWDQADRLCDAFDGFIAKQRSLSLPMPAPESEAA